MAHDVFISYPHEDKTTADAACATLEAAGIRCWIAPRDVEPGAEWAASIIDAINSCRAMLLIFSANANRSRQVHREVEKAFDREVPVIPFRIESVRPEKSLDYYLGAVHWLDALSPPIEAHLHRLREKLELLLGKEETAILPLGQQNRAKAQEAQTKLLKELQSKIDQLRMEVKEAANRGDYQRAGEILYGQIPPLQKQMREYGGEDRTFLEEQVKKFAKIDRDIQKFTQALSLDPDNVKILRERGWAYSEKGDLGRALKDYEKITCINPNDKYGFCSCAHIYTELDMLNRAIDCYSQALRIDPTDAGNFWSRGGLFERRGQDDDAISDYRQAIRIDPKVSLDVNFFRSRGDWHRTISARYDRAIKYFNEQLSQRAGDAETLWRRGLAHQSKGDHDQAIADFDAANRADPTVNLFQLRGLSYVGKGNYPRAIEEYDAALRLDPKAWGTLYCRSLAKRKIGDAKGADEDMNAATKLQPDVASRMAHVKC
jgi:tetratricopeptide (TPR) repeat protein